MSTSKKDHKDSQQMLIRSTSIMSLGTLSSRILGFVRDIVLATLLGTAAMADAFFVAFRIPNLFRDLVGEGAANSAFVPVFSDYVEKKDDEALRKFLSALFVLILILLGVVTVLGIALAPLIVRAIAPGFINEPDKLELTISLTKLMFPYLIFICLTAYSMGILYTMRSFTTPAFSPCLLNIALIASAVIAAWNMDKPVYGLAIGVLVGGLLQLGVQIKPLMKHGIRFSRPTTLKHPGAIKVGKLLIPRVFGAVVYQSTVFVDTFCASLATIVGAGGISAIYYSNRIIQFPLAVFGIALASAALPSMSGMASRNDKEQLKQTIVFSLENVFFILVPSAVFLILLSKPLIRVLFERGEFDAYSTLITSKAITFYALGLASFGGIKILVTAFHALQDTKTPVKVAAGCLVLNAGLNFLLMHPFKIGGIALASSIAATVDFAILFFMMDHRLGGLRSDLTGYFIKLTVAAVIMGLVIFWTWPIFAPFNEIMALFIIGHLGLLVFFGVCLILKVPQAIKISDWINRHLGVANGNGSNHH